MYEHQFSQNNRDALSNLMCSHKDAAVNVNTLIDTDVKAILNSWNNLCSDPELEHKNNEYFNKAEQWLNNLGIETRTEYGNVLPTYNLFLKLGEWLTMKEAGVYRQPSDYNIETRQNSAWGRQLDE